MHEFDWNDWTLCLVDQITTRLFSLKSHNDLKSMLSTEPNRMNRITLKTASSLSKIVDKHQRTNNNNCASYNSALYLYVLWIRMCWPSCVCVCVWLLFSARAERCAVYFVCVCSAYPHIQSIYLWTLLLPPSILRAKICLELYLKNLVLRFAGWPCLLQH